MYRKIKSQLLPKIPFSRKKLSAIPETERSPMHPDSKSISKIPDYKLSCTANVYLGLQIRHNRVSLLVSRNVRPQNGINDLTNFVDDV